MIGFVFMCVLVPCNVSPWTETINIAIILIETFGWKVLTVPHFYIHFYLHISVQQEK